MSETTEKPQASKAQKQSAAKSESAANVDVVNKTELPVSATTNDDVVDVTVGNAEKFEPIEGHEKVTRNDLRLAFIQAGFVRVQHVRADAQQVERAIDELLSMWDEK